MEMLALLLLCFCSDVFSWDFNAVDWEKVRSNESYARQVRHEQHEAALKDSVVYQQKKKS